MIVEIDKSSGFCFGVINAIQAAENELKNTDLLYCLGDIVHNGMEVKRLEDMGLKSISKDEYFKLKNCNVLIRAHGEPPETYEYAKANDIKLIDATCPVVLTLQRKIKNAYQNQLNQNGQLVIFGKKGHAEVVGLNGQTNYNAIVIEKTGDIEKIDASRPVSLYSQTTKRIEDFHEISEKVREKIESDISVDINDTICRQVSNRVPNLKEFAKRFDLILFVAGQKSSNGQYLYTICKEVNAKTFRVSQVDEIDKTWFDENIKSVGICGATSTPQWLMEEVAQWVNSNFD